MTKPHRLCPGSLVDVDLISQISRSLILLLCCVSCCCAVDIQVQQKVAFENDSVTLPCHTNRSSKLLTVEWSKDGITPNITLLYRHGQETLEEKNQDFTNRSELTLKEVMYGNVSLVISKLRLSDKGRHMCRTMVGNQLQVEAVLELVVGTVSEPDLTFVPPGEDGGLTLECRAERWFPQPDITFRDEKGDVMKSEPLRTAPNEAGGFTATMRLSSQSLTERVTCIVHQPLLNQTRNATIYIPDICSASCTKYITVIVLETFFLFLLIIIGLVFLWKNRGCSSVGTQKTPPPQREENSRIIEFTQQNAKLTSDIDEKDRIIFKLKEQLMSKGSAAQQKLQPTTCSGSSINTSQHVTGNTPPAETSASHSPKSSTVSKVNDSKPAVVDQQGPSPSKKTRSKSTPALFANDYAATSSSSLTPTSKGSNIPRSVSFSGTCSRTIITSHRYTMSNPFSVLADLTEESESLISDNINQQH